MPELCVVCHAEPGPLCEADLKAVDRQLRDLPARLLRVAGVLAPARTPAGERVAMSAHVHSALPARTDALSLLGPGADVPATLSPLLRHWYVKRKVRVTTHIVGVARMVDVEVTDWHSEAVGADDDKLTMVENDNGDQVGVAPPREWLDQQVRRWRAHFGHHVPARTQLGGITPYVPAAWRHLLALPGGLDAIAFLAAVHQTTRAGRAAQARMAYRGLLATPAATPERDPVAAERWAVDYTRTMRWDVDYLRTWLAKAAGEDDLDIGAFTAQLAALHAEIGRVLGDTPDQEWIGRCPAFLTEYDDDGEPTGRKKPCGGALWQDNTEFTAEVQCPRCRMTWGTRGTAGTGTAREIRRVWPVDRRKRYKARDIDRLTMPKCPACGNKVIVDWREVTGSRDTERTWKPVAARCPTGCAEARRVL